MGPAAAEVLRFGIIGCGCIGQEHIRNLALIPNARVVAIADPHDISRQGAVACLAQPATNSVEICTGYEELLALPQVDAVIIATPNDHHAQCLEAVVASGKHCLIEKPFCTTLEDCAKAEAKIATAASASGARLFWCAMEYRYIPTVARLINEADEGSVGQLRMLTIREHRFPFLRKVRKRN